MENNQQQTTFEKHREEKQSEPSQEKETDIAIIGMACRFPGAENYREFWENIRQGRSSIEEIPMERWDWKAHWGDPRNEDNKTNSKWGGFIKDVDTFDPDFFGISPREVESMDPQQRIMLELAWLCFEDSGICPSNLSGKKIGVFVGAANFDYKELLEREFYSIESHYATGIGASVIPSRISYYFNFKGPSVHLDTACSSSLNAIHLATRSLQQGECSMALAGGVSLLLTPPRYISFSKMGLLSPTGSCKTFDEAADGIVRSEGAGFILLKPLEKALEDGNSIYGVLKGSAINHSGKTYSLTYPNPEAQSEVIIDAYERAGITPESISYIETHGTGTPKGDPIEFQGLIKAFKFFSPREEEIIRIPYCGLGSVKTNIGHLEAAAGIASVIKVLLSMKHKQLPGLQNFKQLNQRILIQDSPFYIVDQLQEWNPLKGAKNQNLPRRAGVSCFGFAGTNAHVVIEEAPVNTRSSNEKFPYYLICLSAKTEKALLQKERDLAFWLEKEGGQNNIANISATLLLGREHFVIRAAYVVRDVQELQNKIQEVLEHGRAEGYFRESSANKGNPIQPLFKELGRSILKELNSGMEIKAQEYGSKLMVLAELYAKGYELDGKVIFTDNMIPHISLPTYPFARERYWIPEIGTNVSNLTTSPAITTLIHPLLHQNTSDFSEQRFSSTFTGQEFFLADYIVKSQRVLPRVAYLEMARVAVEQAAGALEEGQIEIQLKNVIWAQPIVVGDQPVRVHIGLFPEDNGEISYEIYSESEEADVEPVIHSQGIAILNVPSEALFLDLKALQAQCTQSSISSKRCYKAFSAMRIDYGLGYQGIEKVYVGSGQVLAKLSLPSSVANTQDQFVLHPSLMDSALQASIGLMMGVGETMPFDSKAPLKPSLPIALQELEILGKCTSTMWALIQYSEGNQAEDKVKLDINLCDEQGIIRVKTKGLAFQGESKPLITRHSEQPLTAAESIFANISEKPSGISLRSLSDEQILSSKSPGQTQQTVTLSTTSISLSQPRIDEVKPMIQTAISVEALQEELITSLAEALYMKRSDIDVDKKFIDMGLDSIIGVEWIKAINKQYGISLTATKVYDYPNICEFAGFLEKELNIQGDPTISNPVSLVAGQSSSKVLLQSIVLPSLESTKTLRAPTTQPIATKNQGDPSLSSISVEALQEELITSLAEALYMKRSDIDVDKKFIDMGLDSIIGVEWIKAINKQYGTSMTATKVYDYPTVCEFVGFLEKELKTHGSGLNQTFLESTAPLSLLEMLQKVHQGTLDIGQAEILLRNYI